MKMIKIQFEFTDAQAAADFLAKHVPTTAPVAEQWTPAQQQEMADQRAEPLVFNKTAKAEAPKAEPAATTSSEKPVESPAAGAADECSYDDLKRSIMKLVAIDPKHMREIADSFGVKTFQGTAADVWPKAKKAVDDKIVALRG